jgi:hypothetical protein
MSRLQTLFERLERAGDRISPIVVKEVRQLTRGREFHVSFSISLLIGLAVASLGAADAVDGRGTSGAWTFTALMGCLGLLGLASVPLSAFNALRNERLEQTLELITLTALSPRRVVIGKLFAQGVKLATFFAGLAPFVAMSFLLGGIDFATILVSLAILFMWSIWACAACLFLGSLFKTRAMSGLLFGGVVIVLLVVLIVFGGSRMVYFLVMGGGGSMGMGLAGASFWWGLAMTTTFGLASLVNLVLLAENRLSLPTENRITPLRVGLLVQFLLIVGWSLSYFNSTASPGGAKWGFSMLSVFGGLHLALVAMFAVTEDLVLPRRVLMSMQSRPAWQRPFAMFLPGGGRGAVYVLMQMGLLVGAAWLLGSEPAWYVLAICGYICFYTGVPAAAFRLMWPYAPSFPLRAAVLGLLAVMMLLPDIVVYMWDPAGFNDAFSPRHVLNPFWTLSRSYTEQAGYGFLIAAIGVTGLFAYAAVIYKGARITVRPVPSDAIETKAAPAAVGASRGASVVD